MSFCFDIIIKRRSLPTEIFTHIKNKHPHLLTILFVNSVMNKTQTKLKGTPRAHTGRHNWSGSLSHSIGKQHNSRLAFLTWLSYHESHSHYIMKLAFSFSAQMNVKVSISLGISVPHHSFLNSKITLYSGNEANNITSKDDGRGIPLCPALYVRKVK